MSNAAADSPGLEPLQGLGNAALAGLGAFGLLNPRHIFFLMAVGQPGKGCAGGGVGGQRLQQVCGRSHRARVGVGFPPGDLPDEAVFVTGQVSDWSQAWATTPQGQPLRGLRRESFVLQVMLFRRDLGVDCLALMALLDPWREAVEVALLGDHTLGGVLGEAGMAQIEVMAQDESTSGDRGRELGLTINVRCEALISIGES